MPRKCYLVITIDVEPDCSPTWHYSKPLTFDGVSIGIKERLQPLFNKYNVRPTYLLNNVVMEDPRSVEALSNLQGHFELGTHLHPEFIEPEKQFPSYAGVKAENNQCFLPPAVEFAKMKNLTDLFIKCFHRRPLAFRAGRFSAGANTIRCLRELGYKVDTSVTPHINWNDPTRQKPVDYSQAPEQPYFLDEDSLVTAKSFSNGKILEVPVTIGTQLKLFLLRPAWLRPSYSSGRRMIKLIRQYIRKYENSRPLVINMMFHNVEVVPGKSPYSPSERECKNHLNAIENVLGYCRNQGFQGGVGLSNLYDVFTENENGAGSEDKG